MEGDVLDRATLEAVMIGQDVVYANLDGEPHATVRNRSITSADLPLPCVVTRKRIDEVWVGKLAGASGCQDGFDAALAKIRQQAGA